jgi:hypothetical protein
MTNRPFDDAYLFAYSAEHVWYEIYMFFGMKEMFSPPSMIVAPSGEKVRMVNCALIESFGIHFRNIIDFLYTDDPQPTDVVAADYCAEWAKLRFPISQELEKARTRANKELAHLTTQRIAGAPQEKNWDFAGLAEKIRPSLHLFVKHARAGALAPKVSQAIR